MTRYQACRALGLGPISSALVCFTHAIFEAPKGKIAILHMVISYDVNMPYEKGMKICLTGE